MHLLFYGKPQVLLLGMETVSNFLKRLSVKVRRTFISGPAESDLFLPTQQGKIYDSPESAESIHSFVKTYSLSLTELLEPDICKYPTFNAFFARFAILQVDFTIL